MANTYKVVRLEPLLNSPTHETHAGKVCQVIIGVTAEDGDGNSAYIDGTFSYETSKCPALSTFNSKVVALVSQFVADNGWIKSLDSQLEGMKDRPVSPEDFERPEVTIDTTVEPAEGSPANPTPEPEPEVLEEPVEEPEVLEEPVEEPEPVDPITPVGDDE